MANGQTMGETKTLLTVKEVARRTGLTDHTIRYYDGMNLFPYVTRGDGNERLFSEGDIEWVKLVTCLRKTKLPIAQIAHYVDLCRLGDETIAERARIIARQEESLLREMEDMKGQLETIRKKKKYYDDLLSGRTRNDRWNPENGTGGECGSGDLR